MFYKCLLLTLYSFTSHLYHDDLSYILNIKLIIYMAYKQSDLEVY